MIGRAGAAEVHADDVAAWIEVLTQDAGWATLDVTPDKSRRPDTLAGGIGSGSAVILQPPPPPPPPPAPDPAVPRATEIDEDPEQGAPDVEEESPEEASGLSPALLIAGSAVGIPLLLILVFAAIVVSLKLLRRRGRRHGSPTHQVLGAWGELRDRLAEAGLRGRPSDTPKETIGFISHEAARQKQVEIDTQRLDFIAEAANYAAYAPVDPDQRLVDQAWESVRAAVDELKKDFSMRRRLIMRVDPRSLTRRTRS